MRVNKADGGLVSQTASTQSTNPIGSLLKTLADIVRKVLQALAPVLSRVNYAASMTSAAGRNPKVIWAGNLKPGQAGTPQGQALIAKQERVLILLAQLLANSLANSDPAKAKESQVLTAQIKAIILNDEATVAGQEAHDRGVETAAAEQKYGAGTASKPQLVPSGGGDWIQSNGQWVHPEVARARAAQDSAEGRGVEARAKSDEATAQVEVYAADPEYRSAVAGANRTLAKTLAPEGITFEIKATKPLAQAQSDLKDAQGVAGKATQSRQKREQAESVLLAALVDKNKVRGPQAPNAAAVGPAESSESSTVSDRRVDYEGKEVRAKFAEYGQLSAEADLLDVELSELVAQQLIRTTQPGTPERTEAERMAGAAPNQRSVAEANRNVAVKASDLADADRDVAWAKFQAAPIEDAALNNLREKSPHLFKADGFYDGNRKYSGNLRNVTVDDDRKDGQLYATIVYENKTLVIQLTFAPGAKNIRRGAHERDIDVAWSNINGCGPNSLLVAQQRKQAAEAAFASSAVEQIKVNIELAGRTIPALEAALGTALTDHGPAIPVGGPGESAPFAGAVKATMDGVEVWVHSDVAVILSALNATRDLEHDLQVQLRSAEAWHDFAKFTATLPTKLLNEDSGQHQSYLKAAYYQSRRTEATTQIELTFGAMTLEALPNGKALFGVEHALGGKDLDSALEMAGAGPKEAEAMSAKIRELGGDKARVTFVPFQYIDASVGSQQMLFAIVRGLDGQDHVVDNRGSDYDLAGRKPENIKSFIETYQNDNVLAESGTIIVPKNFSFTATNEKVETEAFQAHIPTVFDKVVDPIATGVATVGGVLAFVPGVNIVAAPLALVAGTYLGARQLQNFGEDIYYGREITVGRVFTELLSVGTMVFPLAGSASRFVGLRQAGMTTVASARTSIGATYGRTSYYQDAGLIMQGATGTALSVARTLDLASIAAGAPLILVSANNLMTHGDEPGAGSLMELMNFASGVYGTTAGLRAHVEQGRAAPQPATQRARHVATSTTFTHPALGTAALPSGLGGLGTARGGGPQGVVANTQPASQPGGSRNDPGTTDRSAEPHTNGVDPVVGEGAPAPSPAATVLPTVVDAVTAGQIVNSGGTGHGDTGNGNTEQQARPGRSLEEGRASGPRQSVVADDASPPPRIAGPASATGVLKPHLWMTGSSPVMDAVGGAGDLRHLTDGTGASPEEVMARIREKLEQEANKPQPRNLSAGAQPKGGPDQQLITQGRGLVGQSPDPQVDGALNSVLHYLAGAPKTAPGYGRALSDLQALVRHIENPGQTLTLGPTLARAQAYAIDSTQRSVDWPTTVPSRHGVAETSRQRAAEPDGGPASVPDLLQRWTELRESRGPLTAPDWLRAAMEAERSAASQPQPARWTQTEPWTWQKNAPDIRVLGLVRARINSGALARPIGFQLGSQVDASPVGSPTWRSFSVGLGVKSNFRSVGAASKEGLRETRDALQSAAGVSIRPNEHRNVSSAQLGAPVSHQVAFQFKGADLLKAGEDLIFGKQAHPVFGLLPKKARVVPASKTGSPNPQGHVVEIVYGLSLRSKSVELQPGETDVFGAPESNKAGFVHFEGAVPYEKVMLEDKLYLHPAWVNALPNAIGKFIPRIALERRHEVAMDAAFHQDFTVSREFLDLNQTVLGKLRLRTQVVVNNPDDAAALAKAPSAELLQELRAKGAIDPDQRLTYARGSGSGLRQSAVPGLPLKEAIVDLAGNKRRVWSPGSSRLEIIINEQFKPRRSFNLDRLLLAKAPTTLSHYVPSDGPIFWGMFGDKDNVAMTTIRTAALSMQAFTFGVPGMPALQLPLAVSIEGRLFYKTKLPDAAPAVAAERTTSWEFPTADGLVLAVDGPRWLKRLDARADTGRIAVFPRGGNEAVGKWLTGLEAQATPSQKVAIADFRRDVLPGLKDESFLTPEQAAAVHDFIVGQARPKTGRPQDGIVELRPGALELPLKAWYETHGFTVEIARRNPMPLWDAARQNLETLRVRSEPDGDSASRPARPATETPDELKPHFWSVGSARALDAATGPDYLRHLSDGTGAAPEDVLARIRERLEQEANKPEPRDLSAAAQPQGGPNQQLIAKGRGLVGQSPDQKVDGALTLALGYLAKARETAPGYRQAIADLGHLVQHIENPAQGAFDARLQAVLARANSYVFNRVMDPEAQWPLTVHRAPAAKPKPAVVQPSAGAAAANPTAPQRTAGSDALLSPGVASLIGQHGVSLMPNLAAQVRASKAFKPTPDDDRAVRLFPQPSGDPGMQTRFALTMQRPVDVYGQQGGAPATGLLTADTQFFDNYADAAAAVANLPPPKGSLRGSFVYKVEADAKDIAGIGNLAEIPADWLPGAQFVYRSGDVFPAVALRPAPGAAAVSQPAVATPRQVQVPPQPHVGQAATANTGSIDPIAEARQSPQITKRPAFAGPQKNLKKTFVDLADVYWRKKQSGASLPEPDAQMKAQTAYLATAQSPDDHALKNRRFHKKVADYATRQVPHLFGAHDYTAVRYIEGPVPPQEIMGGGGSHPALNLSDFTLHSSFEGAREAVQQRPAPAGKKRRKQAAPGGYVYRLVGPKDVLADAIASGSIETTLVEGGLRVFGDGSAYPFSVVNRDAAYAPGQNETFVKGDRPVGRKDKLRIVGTNVGYVGGAAFGAYMTARLGTGSHIGARDLLSSLAIYAWLYRCGIAGIRQGAKIRLQKRQHNAALVSDVAHDKFKPGEALLDQIGRQVTGGQGRRLGIEKTDRQRYASAIEMAKNAVENGKTPNPATMMVVREAVVDIATQPLLGKRGFFHRVGNKSEIEQAAAELHRDPTQSAPWLTIADAHLDILKRRTTGWHGAIWGHSRADRMNYLLAFETLRANRLDAEAMKVLETAPGRLISPNTPTGRILEFARYASFGISNANTTRLVTNPFLDPGAYRYLGVLDTFDGAATLASNSASAVFLFGNIPGVVGTASKRGVGDADFNAPKKAAEELNASASAGNVPATQAQPGTPAQSGTAPAGKNQKPHPTYPATSGGKIIGPVRRFLASAGDPKAVAHDGRLPDGPPEADGTQKYVPMYKPSLVQRWAQYASAGDAAGMVPFFAADGVHFVEALAERQYVLAGIEGTKLVANWCIFRAAQKDHIDEYRSNRGMGPIVWHSRVTDMFNAPLNGAERNPSSIDKPWLRYGLPPLVLLGAGVAVRVGLSLAFPWEPIEEPPQPVTPPDPAPVPGPVQNPLLPGPGGLYRAVENMNDGAGPEPEGSNAPAVNSFMRFVTTEEKTGSTLAA
ncbi:hypothetical protein LJR090_000146 [Bosea sp. LjRoot90]|uniref:hypothetical protein n=1 Tax=Bosea sp. LjRoot90 TaxID=3342342 RepID=UPI003ECC8EF0